MDKYAKANQYADLIITKKMSIREVAKYVGVSASTVHKYISNYCTGVIRKIRLKSQLSRNTEDRFLKGIKKR